MTGAWSCAGPGSRRATWRGWGGRPSDGPWPSRRASGTGPCGWRRAQLGIVRVLQERIHSVDSNLQLFSHLLPDPAVGFFRTLVLLLNVIKLRCHDVKLGFESLIFFSVNLGSETHRMQLERGFKVLRDCNRGVRVPERMKN